MVVDNINISEYILTITSWNKFKSQFLIECDFYGC